MERDQKIAVVTGGNRGIGFDIVKCLSSPPYCMHVVLCCRNIKNGNNAINELKNELNERNIISIELDLDSYDSMKRATRRIQDMFGNVDLVINNAALVEYETSSDYLKRSIKTNYHGVSSFTDLITPLVRQGGRIIFESSSLAKLYLVNDEIKKKILSDDCITREELTAFIHGLEDDFVDCERKGVSWEPARPGLGGYCYGIGKWEVRLFSP